MADENRNDLVLSPNEYAYVLDTTKGLCRPEQDKPF